MEAAVCLFAGEVGARMLAGADPRSGADVDGKPVHEQQKIFELIGRMASHEEHREFYAGRVGKLTVALAQKAREAILALARRLYAVGRVEGTDAYEILYRNQQPGGVQIVRELLDPMA